MQLDKNDSLHKVQYLWKFTEKFLLERQILEQKRTVENIDLFTYQKIYLFK